MSDKRTFWNSCPRKLGYFPESICPLGLKSADPDISENDKVCIWFINSKKHYYCFWKWVRDKSNKEGCFDPLANDKIATLLNCSSSKVNNLYKSAISNLQNLKEFQDLNEKS